MVLCILVLTCGRPLADVYACGKLYIATNKVLMFVSEITVNETLTKMFHIFKMKTELVFSITIKG